MTTWLRYLASIDPSLEYIVRLKINPQPCTLEACTPFDSQGSLGCGLGCEVHRPLVPMITNILNIVVYATLQPRDDLCISMYRARYQERPTGSTNCRP